MSDDDHDLEFVPLPAFAWKTRPLSVPLTVDECRTAIHLTNGILPDAAALLCTPLIRLVRFIDRTPNLQLLLDETHRLAVIVAASEPLRALYAPDSDDRRREWASTKILATRAAQALAHPLTPAPPLAPSSSPSHLALSANGRGEITFRWRTDADDAKTIEHDPDGGDPLPSSPSSDRPPL